MIRERTETQCDGTNDGVVSNKGEVATNEKASVKR